ncbi:Rho-type GTPase activating protein Rga1 [Blastocladiella emersonii ATCC 22665]|nr:Rho-type GTPase activating protein Rga1 [Blastocladiella emersonii ATCC 22665]
MATNNTTSNGISDAPDLAPPAGTVSRSTSPGGSATATPKPARPPKLCTACGQVMTGQFVRALGGTYHLGCFKCMDCDQIVAAKFFPITDADGTPHPLCERDYFARLDLLCAKCGGALRGSYIHALGRKYHVEHFTCSQCPTVFGPSESYFEHDGAVYCHFHFSTQYAAVCTGCRVAILKQFVEIARNGVEEQWHPECYMIHKSWNVTLAAPAPPAALPASQPPSSSDIDEGNGTSDERDGDSGADDVDDDDDDDAPLVRHNRSRRAPPTKSSAELRLEQQAMEEQATRIWSVLSVFEESAAACISDMLLHVSNGNYVEGIHEAASFILHVEVLFQGIDMVDDRLARAAPGDRVGVIPHREPKLLCKKIVGFFSLLSHAGNLAATADGTGARQRLGITQELLSLVTSLAHLLKVLIRQALVGALRLERVHAANGAVADFLDTLMDLLSDDQDRRLRMVLDTDVKSDLCFHCRATIEEACIARGPLRWHVPCFRCTTCAKPLATDLAGAAFVPATSEETAAVVAAAAATESAEVAAPPPASSSAPPVPGRIMCTECIAAAGITLPEPSAIPDDADEFAAPASWTATVSRRAVAALAAPFEHVTPLSQYTFLLRVALKRLLGLLHVEEEGLTDALQDPRRKRVLSGSAVDATSAAVAAAAAAAAQAAAQAAAAAQPPLNPAALAQAAAASSLIKPRSDSLPRNASTGTTSTGSPQPTPLAIPMVADDPAGTSPPGPPPALPGWAPGIPVGAPAILTLGHAPPSPISQPPPHASLSRAAGMRSPPPPTAGPPQHPAAPPGEIWFSELGALEAFLVRHLAVRDLEPILVGAGIMRADEVVAMIDDGGSNGKKAAAAAAAAGGSGGGMWGKFVSSFVKGAGRSSKKSAAAAAAAHEHHHHHHGHGHFGSGSAAVAASGAGVVVNHGAATGTGVLVTPSGSGYAPATASAFGYAGPSGSASAAAFQGVTGSPASAGAAPFPVPIPGTFGVSLDVLVHRSGVSSSLGAGPGRIEVPAFIDTCIGILRAGDLHVEGVFRKNGNIKRLNTVREALDANPVAALEALREDGPVQNAALLKKFFRELPEPLMTFRLYKLFTSSTQITDENTRRRVLHYGICLLPKPNRDVLEVLLLCLRDVAAACSVPTDDDPERGSRMDYSNLATIMAPNLLVPPPRHEEHHMAAVACIFDLLMWQETMWTVPRALAEILRTSVTPEVLDSSAHNPKELLRRVETLARAAGTGSGAPRQHRMSGVHPSLSRSDVSVVAHAQGVLHAPSNALIEDAAAAAAAVASSSSSRSPNP